MNAWNIFVDGKIHANVYSGVRADNVKNRAKVVEEWKQHPCTKQIWNTVYEGRNITARPYQINILDKCGN